MKRLDWCLPVILACLLSVVSPSRAAGAESGGHRADTAKPKLALSVSHAFPLPYVLQHQQFHLGQTLLVFGTRPEADRPTDPAATPGRRMIERDWILEDGSAAIWVTGIPAPAEGRPIAVMAQLEQRDGSTFLRATHVMAVGQGKSATLRRGEYLIYELPGSKSNTCPVELIGDSVEIAHHDPFESVILRAVRPGVSTLKVFSRWWRSTEDKLIREYELTVE